MDYIGCVRAVLLVGLFPYLLIAPELIHPIWVNPSGWHAMGTVILEHTEWGLTWWLSAGGSSVHTQPRDRTVLNPLDCWLRICIGIVSYFLVLPTWPLAWG